MSIAQITSLLEFCLTHTSFLFQGKYYEQVQGAAMGSPISPLIANIFMEEFEVQALSSFPHPLPSGSGLWMTPLSSTRQNTVRTFYNTSTAKTLTSNSQWNLHNSTHSPSWTLSSQYNQTTPSAPQCTENPPTQINTYTGTATTTSQQNKVSSTPWHIGPKLYLQLRLAWIRNWTTSKQPSNTANSPLGPQSMATQVQPVQTTLQQPLQQYQQQQANRQNQKQGHHSSTLHTQCK